MIWGFKHGEYPPAQVVFAWYPVRLVDGRWAWWETVIRHGNSVDRSYTYTAIARAR